MTKTDTAAEPEQDGAVPVNDEAVKHDATSEPKQDRATLANEEAIKSNTATKTDTAAEPEQNGAVPVNNEATKHDPTSEPKQDVATPANEDAIKSNTTTKTDTAAGPEQDGAVPADEAAKVVVTPIIEPNNDPVKDAAAPGSDPKTEPVKDVAAPAAEPNSEPAMDAAAKESGDAMVAAEEPVVVEPPVVSQLHQLIEKRLERYVTRKADREGVEAYYKANGYKPLWVTENGETDRSKAAIAYLQQVETVGLDPRDYPAPDFQSGATPEDLAADELRLTNSVLTYARHAEIGRIHFSRVGADIFFNLEPPNPAEVLARLAEEQDTAAALDSYNPPQPGFQALKAKLAEARKGLTAKAEAKEPKHVRVPGGRILRPGMRDSRVTVLRQRLDIAGDKESTVYDEDVIEAVKAFQTQGDLYVDGMVGPNTLAALNGEETHVPADPIDTILVNMERWRWLPRKLGNSDDTYVIVNVPDYTLSLMHHGKLFWKTKIVVGKPTNMTPMVSAEMKFITVNPTWNVPPSIVENEYLPAIEQDPTVLDRYGLRISQDQNGFVRIWQPPGPGNALGRLRFNFPNKFLVYQHDTPDKYLFKRTKRAYSHGCMRVLNPVDYAEKLLSIELPQENYTKRKIESMYGDNEININFPKPIPVHLTYQTAFVDEDGNLQFRDDVYRRDARMIQILHSRELRVAGTAVDHPPDTSAKPVRMPVGMFSAYGDGSYGSYGGPGFFDWLFGGTDAPMESPRYRRIYRPRGFIGPPNGRYSRR
jgi:murein L,D-transpeptidase YcbB/YkuD